MVRRDPAAAPPGPIDMGGILTVNDRDQLKHAFRRLTLEHRSVLVFHHVLGLPLPELAARLGSRSAPPSLVSATRPLRCAQASTPTTERRLPRSVSHDRTPSRDTRVAAFFDAHQPDLPDRAFDAVRRDIHRTRQLIVIGPLREPGSMLGGQPVVAPVVVLAVGIAFLNLRPVLGPGGAPMPTATPTVVPSPSVSASAAASPSGPTVYTSPLYGYTIALPGGWTVGPARFAGMERQRRVILSVLSTGSSARSVSAPGGSPARSAATWLHSCRTASRPPRATIPTPVQSPNPRSTSRSRSVASRGYCSGGTAGP